MAHPIDITKLARDLMDEHYLTEVDFGFFDSKKTLGRCRFRNEVPFLIELSRDFVRVNTIEVMEETIRHEIAHAIAGRKAGHGPAWKRVAKQVGARPVRCAGPDDCETPLGNHNAFCFSCSTTKPVAVRTQKPKVGATYRCPKHKVPIVWFSKNQASNQTFLANVVKSRIAS